MLASFLVCFRLPHELHLRIFHPRSEARGKPVSDGKAPCRGVWKRCAMALNGHFNRSPGGAIALLSGLVLCLCSAEPVHAAAQGSLGATSTGTVTITLSVAPRARISGLTDMSFTQVDPNDPATATQDVCVLSNTISKSYTITARGSGAGGEFVLSSGARTVPFKVRWSADASMEGAGLSSGVPSGALTSAAADQSCTSGNTRLSVEIAQSALQLAEPGLAYTGILNLTVSPQ